MNRSYGGGSRGQYDPVRRRGAIALVVGAAFAVLLVVGLFLLLRGGEEESGSRPAMQSTTTSNPAAGGPETTSLIITETTEPEQDTGAIEEEAAEPESQDTDEAAAASPGEESGVDKQGDGGSEEAVEGTPVDQDGSGNGSESGGTGSDGSQSGEQAAGTGGTPPQGEGSRTEESEVAAKEPGVFDPAGKNPEPGDLTETDRQRVEFTVANFVNATYGYTGDDPTEYARGIERNVMLPAFYDSPGSEKIKQYVDAVKEGEISSSASLDRFEITQTKPLGVSGTAYFVVGESYGEQGRIEGETKEYRQDITLVPQGEVYKIRGVSVEKEVG